MAKFDPKRPHGTVTGPGCKYAYEQDGKYFRGSGEECDSEGVLVDFPPPAVAKVDPATQADEPKSDPKPATKPAAKTKGKAAPFGE